MRGGTVQINWHDTKPVLTLDFHPISGILATGGADFDIKLWLVNSGQGEKKIPGTSYQSSLSYHGSAVNALRFSPSGEQLASGADGGELILWKLHSSDAGQAWKVLKTLSFHRKDVLDLQWSTDGAFLISGSVDNSCIIWDVNKGSVHQILDAHFHYVQGVAWDPLAMYAASLSSDRSCRIYVNKPTKTKGIEKMNFVCQHVITKVDQQIVDNSKSAKSHLFHDETLPSFFRRLSWSPEGTFLLVPGGSYKISPISEPVNTAYVFSRKDLSRPALMLPGASKPVVAVRFCSRTFCLRGSTSSAFFKLPYRLIFAVATLNSLYIYDTESVQPIAVLAGLHYAAITDISWSPSGKYLALSSQDGYCTLVEFEDDELGSSHLLPEERKVADNENFPVKKPEDVRMTEATTNNDQKCGNANAEKSDGKQALPAATKDEKHASPAETDKEKQALPTKTNKEKQPFAAETTIEEQASPAKPNEEKHASPPETTEKKQASPNLVSTPAPNKPAKRRITPMAID